MRRALVTIVCLVFLLGACGGNDDTAAEGDGDSTPTPTPAVSDISPAESPTEDAPAVDVKAEADEIVSCLEDAGIESKFEKGDFPTYEEAGTIDVTFEYEDIGVTVPGAVTLLLHESKDAADKTLKQLNENLLEGDTKAELAGTVVVDDFGTTLDEPEAAEQAASLQSCLG